MIRRVELKDMPQIINMYKNIFEVDMNVKLYNYWYFNKEFSEYDSFVCVREGVVLGHNALIRKHYKINNELVLVAISSGGMVKPESSGIFYRILNNSFKQTNSDILFAFPNKNSLGFFKKLFNFSEVKQTYFTTKKEIKFFEKPLVTKVQRTEEFFNWRIINNPEYNYNTYEIEDLKIVTKAYSDNELDIIFSNCFGQNFIEFVNKKLLKFKRINIIHWDHDYIKSLGFEVSSQYNSFVLKGNIDISDFQFQMIDSDVF
jgi:hypothetical protein